METLYRKDFFIKAIEENKIIRWQGIFEQVVKSYLKFSENDTQYQIEKLQADKAELIEKLEEIYGYLGSHFDGEKVSIGELIQKHKK